jgi:hypothetical protein
MSRGKNIRPQIILSLTDLIDRSLVQSRIISIAFVVCLRTNSVLSGKCFGKGKTKVIYSREGSSPDQRG